MNEKKSTLQDDTCVIKGITYIAEDVPTEAGCKGCTFYQPYGLIESGCAKTPYCTSSFRHDKRNIVWVKKEEKHE